MNNIPISKEELKPFMERSDLKAFAITIWTWLSIAGIFALGILFPSWPMYVLMAFLLGGRFMALAALMHEAGHNTFFKTKKYNEFLTHWLTGPFILMDGKTYSKWHHEHHRNAGTKEDPDLENYLNFPITKMSFVRKIGRDFIGITGLKMALFLILTGKDQLTREKRAPFTLTKSFVYYALIFLTLWYFGQAHLFAVLAVAYFTVYLFIARFRQMAEHAGVKDLFDMNPKYNTRSVHQGIFGFLFFAPTKGLSYHCEHHAFRAVPTYNLKPLHQLLVSRGYYDDIYVPKGYFGILPEIIKS